MYIFKDGEYNVQFGTIPLIHEPHDEEEYQHHLRRLRKQFQNEANDGFVLKQRLRPDNNDEFTLVKKRKQNHRQSTRNTNIHATKHKDIYSKLVNTAIKEGQNNIPKTVMEIQPQGLYEKAHMVQLSYDIRDAKSHNDLNYAEGVFYDAVGYKNLLYIRDLSTPQAAVVHDLDTNTYNIVYHGSDGRDADWESVKSVMKNEFTETNEYKEAERQLEILMEHIAAEDPEAKIHLTGFSLGGAKSLYLAEKYNLEGTHLNPFTSPFSTHERANVPKNKIAKQEIVRIVNDPVTVQSEVPPIFHSHNRRNTHLLPLEENTEVLDAHTLNQFTQKKPRSIDNAVEKDNIKMKGLGHVATIGGAAFGGYEGIQEGRQNSGTVAEEAYRGVLGAAEATLPIVGEDAVVESGLVGFTSSEIKHTFDWIGEHIFGIKKHENKLPEGYTQVWGTEETIPSAEPSQSSVASQSAGFTINPMLTNIHS